MIFNASDVSWNFADSIGILQEFLRCYKQGSGFWQNCNRNKQLDSPELVKQAPFIQFDNLWEIKILVKCTWKEFLQNYMYISYWEERKFETAWHMEKICREWRRTAS